MATSQAKPYGNPKRDLQFVVATNEGSPASKKEMNQMIRQVYANAGLVEYVEKSLFWCGDRVIGTANGRYIAQNDRQIYVANGAFGTITNVSKQRYEILMDDYPESPFYMARSDAREKFELGYAVTCHRMQGSQANVIFTCLSDSFKSQLVCDISWLYTALTRAQSLQIVAGTQETVYDMCSRTKIMERNSFIPQWLTEECNGKATDCLVQDSSRYKRETTVGV